MLKNGFGAGRRTVQSVASTSSVYTQRRPSIVAVAQTLSDTPYVCASCQQTRSYASKGTRGGKLKASAPFQSSIKRLEAHVQYLESSFKDLAKRKAAELAEPGHEVSDEATDEAYKALMAVEQTLPLLTSKESTILQRLPMAVRDRLSASKTSLVKLEQEDWQHMLIALRSNKGFAMLSMKDVTMTLSSLPRPVLAQNTDLVFAMIEEAQLQPKTIIYDILMMANIQVGATSKVREIFMKLKESPVARPTVFSYAHLLNALSVERDIYAASMAFKEMQSAGIAANLIVYTTLVNTCIRAGELKSAWEVYELMKYKSQATAPDLKVYSMMIHACALEGETEKAMNLLQEMNDKGIVPSLETYNALIHACANRKDYFAQAWQYATEMQLKGHKMTTHTMNILLAGCGKVGELTRARMLIRHMLAGSKEVHPDEQSFQALFRAYATFKPPFTAKASKQYKEMLLKTAAATSPTSSSGFVTPHTYHRPGPADESLSTIISDQPAVFPFLPKSTLSTHPETVNEAELIYNHLKTHFNHMISPDVTNALLCVYLNQGYFETLRQAYVRYAPLRNQYTFHTALQSAYETRHITFARQVLADRTAYLSTASYCILSPKERHKLNFSFERLYVNTLARCEFLEEAARRLEEKREDFGQDWKVATLHTFRHKAVQLEDFEMVKLIEDVAVDGWREGEYYEPMQEVGGVTGWQQEAKGVRVKKRPTKERPPQKQAPYGAHAYEDELDEEEFGKKGTAYGR